MMSKNEIDLLFTSNYEHMVDVISKTKITNRNLDFESEDLISHAYEHLLERKEKITSEDKFLPFFYRYITMQIKWYNSTINRLKKDKGLIFPEELFDDREEDFDGELEHKIKLEAIYNKKMIILWEFRNQLETKQEKILFDVIFVKGFRTVKEIHRHYQNCNMKFGMTYIQQDKKKLMDGLKAFIKEKQYK